MKLLLGVSVIAILNQIWGSNGAALLENHELLAAEAHAISKRNTYLDYHPISKRAVQLADLHALAKRQTASENLHAVSKREIQSADELSITKRQALAELQHLITKRAAEGGESLFDLLNKVTNAFARQDYLQLGIIGLDTLLRNDEMHFLAKWILRSARWCLTKLRRIYIYFNPDMEDKGSLAANLQAGGSGILGNLQTATKFLNLLSG